MVIAFTFICGIATGFLAGVAFIMTGDYLADNPTYGGQR